MKQKMKFKNPDFRNPYLIQRLKKPFAATDVENQESNLFRKIASAFSFGGGLVNGGLSDDAMQKLNRIWRYDYMGAAEFEWGAVPKSLDKMAKSQNSLTTGQVSVIASARVWKEGKSKIVSSEGCVFYVCEARFENDVRDTVSRLADSIEANHRTKESVNLAESLVDNEYHKDTVGWHDIDNNYLFFTDVEMYNRFCGLFGIEPVKSAVPIP